MSIADLYRNRGVNPLAVQQGLYRFQPDANTLGLWWCNEGALSVLMDKKATYNAALGAGCSWNALGPWGVSVTFPGSSTGKAGVTVETGVSANFTQEAVCAPNANATIPSEQTSGFQGIMPMTIGPSSAHLGVGFGVYTSGVVVAALKSSFAPSVLCYSTALTANVFHYFALVVTNNAYELFIDGVSVRTKATIGQTVYNEILGFGQFFGQTQYWSGKLAMARLSNNSRSAAEILTNAKLMGFA